MSRYPLWPLWLLLALVVAFLNVWTWSRVDLVVGVPFNLLYQVLLCVAAAVSMAWVLRRAWPTGLDDE